MAEKQDYWNALDKRGIVNQERLDIDPNRVGISHGIGDVGEGLRANVFRGMTSVELGFFGKGKGFRSQPTGSTPESYGATEREDMRQLARINEINLSTHAAPDLGRVSGITDQGFSPVAKEDALHEIERAVSFAADTAGGGAVVVHMGEFPRAVFEADEQFEGHPDEHKKAPVHFVDKRTGQLQQIRRDTPITVPNYKIDPKTGKETREIIRNEETGVAQFRTVTYNDIREKEIREAKEKGREPRPEQRFYNEYFQKQLEAQEGEEMRWTQAALSEEKNLETLKDVKEKYMQSLQEAKNKEIVKQELLTGLQKTGIIPEDTEGYLKYAKLERFKESPEKFLDATIRDHQQSFTFANNNAMAAGKNAFELKENMKNFELIEDYGVRESAETLARAAMTAFETEKAKKLDRLLFISPENWNPESYGNHPKEYKRLILESRKEMERMLLEQKKAGNKQEARKIAADHIQGTFDVGHLNFWRKYFKGSDEEFRTWVDGQIKNLTKEKIIGNVHLSDNFGYHDEHLSPGEGNAPIQRFIKRLEESGYTGKYIGEPGGQKEGFYHTAWTGALKTVGSPIYRVDAQTRSWSDIEQSYFGHVPQSPYFMVGDVAPSKDWSLWSETPLE